jgi:hypothetical protein
MRVEFLCETGTARDRTASPLHDGNRSAGRSRECRRRAQRLRERAESSNIAEAELLEAADTWDDLARHAEALRDAFGRLDKTADRAR